MRDCHITINNDNSVDVSSVSQYIGEHAATQLIITLNDELNSSGIHYYTLSFGMSTDFPNPYLIKFSSDAITDKSAYGYADSGNIYFVLPKALTLFSTLQIQVEAHSTDISDNIIRTVKSPVFEIAFNRSVEGEETIIPEKSFEIIEEMRKALTRVNAVSAEIDAIHGEIESINGSVNGIEAMIDESGVLE